jgi:hypothetical protein
MPPPDGRLDRVLTALVALALLAFYITVQRGEYIAWDGRIMAGVARNIWQNGRLQTLGPYFPDETRFVEGWSQYGVGQSLLLAPFWGIQSRFDPHGAQWMTLANPLVLAAAGAVQYRIGLALGLRRGTAAGMALVFGMLTMAPMYSTELFTEPAATLGTLIVVLALIRWRDARTYAPWMMGFGVAGSILFRVDTLLLVGLALLAVPLFVPRPRLMATRRQWLPALAIPIGAVCVWQGYYNNLRYGSPFRESYSGARFDNPVLEGLQRQLLSPGKGFFWYDPILLAALPGLVWLWRRDRATTTLILGLAIVRVVFCARTPFSDGSVAWGPRYLLPWCGLLTIPLGVCWEQISTWRVRPRAAARIAIGSLAALSAIVVLASTWVSYAQYWNIIGEEYVTLPPDTAQSVADQRIDESYNTISGSPLVVNLRHLDDARPFPLLWFRGGPTAVGVLAVSIAISAAALAVATARVADRARTNTVDRASPGVPILSSPA